MSNEAHEQQRGSQCQQEQQWLQEPSSITLLQIINVLLRRRWLILGGTGALMAGVAGYSLMMSPSYSASAIFMPSRTATMSNRMGSMVGMVGMLGAVEGSSDTPSPEYYMALLQSRPFLETLYADRLDPPLDVEELKKTVSVTAGKSKSTTQQLLTVTVTAETPQLAADLANASLAALVSYRQDSRNSQAGLNREFVEAQLVKAQVSLAEAEKAFATFLTRNRKIATPDLQIEMDRLARAVKTHEEVFITLAKQLELAKIQEHEEQQTIEVIERASPPLKRTSPNRRNMVTIAAFAGIFFFAMLALALEYVKNLNRDEKDVKELLENLGAVKRQLTFGRIG